MITYERDQANAQAWRDLLFQEQQLFNRVLHRALPAVLLSAVDSSGIVCSAKIHNAAPLEYFFIAVALMSAHLFTQCISALRRLSKQMQAARFMIQEGHD